MSSWLTGNANCFAKLCLQEKCRWNRWNLSCCYLARRATHGGSALPHVKLVSSRHQPTCPCVAFAATRMQIIPRWRKPLLLAQKLAATVGSKEPLCDVNSVIDQIPAATKANLSKFCGDVLGQMRKRKPCGAENVENSAEAPAEAAPATPAKKPRVEKLAAAEVSAPISCAPASSKAACQPAPAAPQEEEEFDLDDHDQAVKYLALHWTSPPPNLLPTLNFFVSTLKSRASKSQPLSQLLMKEIVKPKALYTRKNRQDFLSAWKSNRSLRYAAKPKFVQ